MTETTLIAGAISAACTLIACIWLFPPFQTMVERHWLGISLPSRDLPLIYSRHATTNTTMDALLDLLKRDVLPSLLIRQFLFLRVDGTSPEILLAVGVKDDEVIHDQIFVTRTADNMRRTSSVSFPQLSWAQLTLPLQMGDELLGYWFFGRRDPDDTYLANEISILQSLADQTAITLSNIIQTERLRMIYQADINRFEQERLKLALELHDSILNELVGLMMKIDERDLPSAFQDGYQQLIQHLRGIVRDLRPASLAYGLRAALEELADNLMERSGDTVQVTVRLEATEDHLAADVEQHLFRIVQEACTNALRHSKSTEIVISGSVDSQVVDLNVEDNGAGFDVKGRPDLNTLLANNHFGLAGMIERAKLIGASIAIESLPTAGTHIQINWKVVH